MTEVLVLVFVQLFLVWVFVATLAAAMHSHARRRGGA